MESIAFSASDSSTIGDGAAGFFGDQRRGESGTCVAQPSAEVLRSHNPCVVVATTAARTPSPG
jgi:hypothetical protein